MGRKKQASLKDRGFLSALLLSLVLSALTLLVIMFIVSIILYMTNDPTRGAMPGALISLILSAAVSAPITLKTIKDLKLPLLLATSISFAGVIFAIGAVVSGFRLMCLLNMLIYFGVSMLVGFFLLKGGKKKRRAR